MKYHWQRGRLILLISISLAVFVVMGRSLLDSGWGKPKTLVFPQALALPEWELTHQTPLSLKSAEDPRQPIVPGQRYNYQQAHHSQLTLEFFYWLYSYGDVNKMLSLYWQSQSVATAKLPKGEIRSNSQGAYLLYHHQGRAYLTSCLNPIGGSTVTLAQFSQNRNTLDLQPQRWLSILLGLEDTRDWRCLFVQLSTPTSSNSVPENYISLERSWEKLLGSTARYFPTFMKSPYISN